MKLEIVKAHATGNDFVVINDLDGQFGLSSETVRSLCDRHTGVGADGVLRLADRSDPAASIFMDYWNADGSIAEMCGNGIRVLAKYCFDRGILPTDGATIDTRAGARAVRLVSPGEGSDAHVATWVEVDMGEAIWTVDGQVPGESDSGMFTYDFEGSIWHFSTVSFGNPHVVTVVDDLTTAPVKSLGSELSSLFPNGTNVEFVAMEGGRVNARVWERGVGETLSCGTGACAIAAVMRRLGLVTEGPLTVTFPGGSVVVTYDSSTNSFWLSGPVVEVFSAAIDL